MLNTDIAAISLLVVACAATSLTALAVRTFSRSAIA
jgi:hypothetical protein